MKIFVIDIENVPGRYSGQWKKWFPKFFSDNRYEFEWIGFDDVVETKTDEFLSFIPSNDYKARQIQALAGLMTENRINDGDLILFLDAWHPGAIACRQMLLTYNKDVRMAGFWHAGAYDPYDMLGLTGRQYFMAFEKGLHDCYDYNLFATSFNEDLFVVQMGLSGYEIDASKNHIVGFLYNTDHLYEVEKEKIIIFPHRLCYEKQEYMFDEFEVYCKERNLLTDYEFIKTMEVTSNKEEYHALLAKSDIAVSFARQETFGISMMESAMSGCFPIVPDSLSYKELYPRFCRYDPMKKSRDAIYSQIIDLICLRQEYTQIYNGAYSGDKIVAGLQYVISGSKIQQFLIGINR